MRIFRNEDRKAHDATRCVAGLDPQAPADHEREPRRWFAGGAILMRERAPAADIIGGRGGKQRRIRADRVERGHERGRRRAGLHAAAVRAVARMILLVASALAARAAVVGAAGARRCICALERVREDPLLAAAQRHPRREGEYEQSVRRA